MYVQNILEKKVATLEELQGCFNAGMKRRATAATNMNADSSRSHLIFTIIIKTKNLQTEIKSIGKVEQCEVVSRI